MHVRIKERYTELYEKYGGYMCVHNVATYLRVDDPKAKELMKGLPVLKVGRQTRYSTMDVARRLIFMEVR